MQRPGWNVGLGVRSISGGSGIIECQAQKGPWGFSGLNSSLPGGKTETQGQVPSSKHSTSEKWIQAMTPGLLAPRLVFSLLHFSKKRKGKTPRKDRG